MKKKSVRSKGFNFDSFKICTPEAAYVLGLLWADGYVEIPYRVTLKASFDDLIQVKHIFKKIGHWTYRPQKRRKPTWKDQLIIRACSKDFVKFLLKNNYEAKSEVSADKILSIIPDKFKHYWFRGLVDGDGYFQCGKRNRNSSGKKAFGCDSTYNQDWTYFAKLLKCLGIKYKISRRIRLFKNKKTQKSSSIEFYRIADIVKFGNFIYQNYPTDKIGFPRKYAKFKQILEYSFFYSGQTYNKLSGISLSKIGR